MSTSSLFQPIKVGINTLQHRVVLAPLTRYRGTQKEHVPTPWMTTYYTQRGSSPGTLLITEATFISPQAAGYDNVPGIWSKAQIAAWKEVILHDSIYRIV
jgi:NADPH2 dehydrogenase